MKIEWYQRYGVAINAGLIVFDACVLAHAIRASRPLPVICWDSMIFGFQVCLFLWCFTSRQHMRELDDLKRQIDANFLAAMEEIRKQFP